MADTDSTFGPAFAEPPKMAVVNLASADRLDAQYNPTELSEVLGATYAKQQVMGLSHQVKQFQNTEDDLFSFTLFWTSANYGPNGQAAIERARRFLRSLLYPRKVQGGSIRTGGAPRALFVWPNFLSLECVITKLNFNYTRFNVLGRPCLFSVGVTLEEIRDVSITSEDVFEGLDPKGGT